MSIILGCIVGITVLFLLFKPMFGSADEFFSCVKYWLTPDIISLFRGRDHYWQDHWSELKLGVWLALGGGAGFLTTLGIDQLF